MAQELISSNFSESPKTIRAWRILTHRDRSRAVEGAAGAFQGLVATLQGAGTLAVVYDVLAALKARIQGPGPVLGLDDVVALVEVYRARTAGRDPLSLGPPRFTLRVEAAGERLAFHREFSGHLLNPERPGLILDADLLLPVLEGVWAPRTYTEADLQVLLDLDYPAQEGLGTLRVLDTLYRATFGRTIRKAQAGPRILVPLVPGTFRTVQDGRRTLALELAFDDLARVLFGTLFRTPDLAPQLDTDTEGRQRVHDHLRLLLGRLHDGAVRPRATRELQTILAGRGAETEDLEELEEAGPETGS